MTLDELMKKYNGEWQENRAVIYGPDGYYWCVAEKFGGRVSVTSDGKRYGLGSRLPAAQDTKGAVSQDAKNAALPSQGKQRTASSKKDLTGGLDDLFTEL